MVSLASATPLPDIAIYLLDDDKRVRLFPDQQDLFARLVNPAHFGHLDLSRLDAAL